MQDLKIKASKNTITQIRTHKMMMSFKQQITQMTHISYQKQTRYKTIQPLNKTSIVSDKSTDLVEIEDVANEDTFLGANCVDKWGRGFTNVVNNSIKIFMANTIKLITSRWPETGNHIYKHSASTHPSRWKCHPPQLGTLTTTPPTT